MWCNHKIDSGPPLSQATPVTVVRTASQSMLAGLGLAFLDRVGEEAMQGVQWEDVPEQEGDKDESSAGRQRSDWQFGVSHPEVAKDPVFKYVDQLYQVAPGVLTEHGKTKSEWAPFPS
ncbi:hypothetical protein JCM1841_001869, partial [Sporobolomyces salmonicolor]